MRHILDIYVSPCNCFCIYIYVYVDMYLYMFVPTCVYIKYILFVYLARHACKPL